MGSHGIGRAGHTSIQPTPKHTAFKVNSSLVRSIVLLAVCLVNSKAFGQVTANDLDGEPAKYVIYSDPQDSQLGSSLFRVLIAGEKRVQFTKVKSLADAIASDADVLVLVATKRRRGAGPSNWSMDPASLKSLQTRKVIGIGYGASQLFGDLGLEINGGKCMHFGTTVPDVRVVPNKLVDSQSFETPVAVLNQSIADEGRGVVGEVFAMHIPKTSEEAKHIEVVARMASRPNYAPIVRQGNHMLIGIPIPTRHWTSEFERLVREVCVHFHSRHPEDFQVVARELAKPGTYTLDLAERGNTEKPYSRDFFFRFDQPTQLSFTLKHPGRPGVMMMFRGGSGTLTKRLDARNKDPLRIDIKVSDEDIREAGEKYWELHIVNFGQQPTRCELMIAPQE